MEAVAGRSRGCPPGDEAELDADALSWSLSSLLTCLSDVGLELWAWLTPFEDAPRLFGTRGDVETSATSTHST